MNPARTNCWMTGWFLVQRLNLLHPARPYFFDRFFGTLAPFLRASERPIAIACFLLLTFLPDLPLLSVPALRFFMARPTFFEAPLEYFLFFAFLAIALVLRRFWSIRIGTQRSAKGSFSLVKCRETRGVGMTIENKVAFAVLRLMTSSQTRSVPRSSKTSSC